MASNAAAKYGPGLYGLIKQGYNEIPHVYFTFVPLIVLIPSLFVYLNHKIRTKGNYYRQYKVDYIIVRPDDFRAAKMKDSEKTYTSKPDA